MHNSRLLRIALGLSMASTSCWFNKAPRTFTPPPPHVRPAPAADPAVAPPNPPQLKADISITAPAITLMTPPDLPKPPLESKSPPRRGGPSRVAPPPPQPEQPAPPKLEPLLTPDQRRGYNHTIDECLERVRKALEILEKKNLTAEQRDIVTRIKTFQTQAEQAREQDPVTAVSLAKRADLFAQDLLRLP